MSAQRELAAARKAAEASAAASESGGEALARAQIEAAKAMLEAGALAATKETLARYDERSASSSASLLHFFLRPTCPLPLPL